MSGLRNDLLALYERELMFIRNMATEYGDKHPDLKGLELGPGRCKDPHIERLLEGFALLAARVHLRLDDDFPQISNAILEVLYPHFVRPIPAMSVVEMKLAEGKLSSGLSILKGSQLYWKNPGNDVQCKFYTGYHVTLWPIEVKSAIWRAAEGSRLAGHNSDLVATLKLVLRCSSEADFKTLNPASLQFHLFGGSSIVHSLYELLLNNCVSITVRDPDRGSAEPAFELAPEALRPMGFSEDEALLPYDNRSFDGYRILQEYFAFPDKFFFIELNGLKELKEHEFGPQAEITFWIRRFERPNRHQLLEQGVLATTFRLGCTPIVNLFQQEAEPITLDQTKCEYQVKPNERKQATHEIFAIKEVKGHDGQNGASVTYDSFYSFRHASAGVSKPSFWYVHRKKEINDDQPSKVFLSLVDLRGEPVIPDANVLAVSCICSNGSLPFRLRIGVAEGDFELKGQAAVGAIVALKIPTDTLRPPWGKASLWNLISHLSLNYLSLVEKGKESLQEILRLYDFSGINNPHDQIAGITGLSAERSFGTVTSENGVSFARGIRVAMKLDEEKFEGGGVYLFSSILEYFLGLYISMNSFSQLVVSTKREKKVLREWPRRAGKLILV